jgi:hypothetical protein
MPEPFSALYSGHITEPAGEAVHQLLALPPPLVVFMIEARQVRGLIEGLRQLAPEREMKREALGRGEHGPLRPRARPVVEQVRVAPLHEFPRPEIGGLDAGLAPVAEIDAVHDIRLMGRDPLIKQSRVVLCFPVPVEGKRDLVVRDAVRGIIGEFHDRLEEALEVGHVRKGGHRRRRDRAATRQVDRLPVTEQAALREKSRQVAVKTVALIRRHAAKIAVA